MNEKQIILLYLYRVQRKAFGEPISVSMERLVLFSRFIEDDRIKGWVSVLGENIIKKYFDTDKDSYIESVLNSAIDGLKKRLEADNQIFEHEALERKCFLFSGLINFN